MLEPKPARYDTTLYSVIEWLQQFMYLPDPAPFVLVLAVVVANRIPGYPVWLMLVGPPSSGKTDILSTIMGIPNIHMISTLTEASLLSGTAKKERVRNATGGLLRKIGDEGILVHKDFTTVLSMNRDTRGGVLAALREIYDGRWVRQLGTDGGQELFWKGRLGFVAGVTEIIDSHHSVIAALGDRFLYYRMDELPGQLVAEKVLRRDGVSEETRLEIQQLVSVFLECVDIPERSDPLSEAQIEWLGGVANVAAKARSAVERDSFSREITRVLSPESPGRLAGALGQLSCGLTTIGCAHEEAKRLIRRVAIDCIPKDRARLLHLLAASGSDLTAESMRKGEHVDYPKTAVYRALQDMECLRIVERVKQGRNNVEAWKLTSAFATLWKRM